jgi:outer membrane protein
LKALLSLPADQAFDLETPPVETIPVDNILEERPEVIYAMAMQTQPQIKVNSLRLWLLKRHTKLIGDVFIQRSLLLVN